MQWVVVGQIGLPFGIKGQVHIQSFTEPMNNFARYTAWHCERQGRWSPVDIRDLKVHGRGFIGQLHGIHNPEDALSYRGALLRVAREQLPELPPGEYYWSDLIGLRVQTRDGQDLGQVTKLLETGSNDVLVVQGERERLIPYLDDVVLSVDLAGRSLCVDWDPEL